MVAANGSFSSGARSASCQRKTQEKRWVAAEERPFECKFQTQMSLGMSLAPAFAVRIARNLKEFASADVGWEAGIRNLSLRYR